jgi:predicted nucleic acid-binding protein
LRAIIADTGPLYAAIDPDDQYHTRAQAELKQIESANLIICVPIPVYLEAYTLLRYRLGFTPAINFARDCIEAVHFLNFSQEDCRKAIEKAAQFPDQRITLVDAVTAVLAEEISSPVWTYDYHFDVRRSIS